MHIRNHHLINAYLKQEKYDLYIAQAMKNFVGSLINIFIPIYLYSLGYNLRGIALFQILSALASFISVFVVGYFFKEIGSKRLILLSYLFLLSGYIALYFIQVKDLLFFITPLLFGIYVASFYTSYHVELANNIDYSHKSKEIGKATLLTLFICSFAPLLGGIIASISFQYLIILASIILIISLIPLFLSKGIREDSSINLREILINSKPKRILGTLGYGGRLFISFYVWPLILFLYYSVKGIGGLTTILQLLSALFIYLGINLSERYGNSKTLRAFSFIDVVQWLLRLIKNATIIGLLHISYGFIDPMININFDSKIYSIKPKKEKLNVMLMRQIFIYIGKMLSAMIIFLFPSFTLALLLASLFSFFLFIYSFDK